MLKGTTKIELTDVHTGETQVIEKHNAITGALQELFNPVLGHLTSASTLTSQIPVHSSLLGGMLLFDSRIEGDPLPIFAPEGVKLVGCARYNFANTLGSTYMGSYDLNESVISVEEKKAKFVYNFTQAQANGTINSVCLTHINGGFGGYRGDTNAKQVEKRLTDTIYSSPTTKLVRNKKDRTTTVTVSTTDEYLYAIDVDNDVAHYFRLASATTLVVLKRRLGIKQFSLFGGNDAIVGEPVTITLSQAVNTNSNSSNTYFFNVEDQALYFITTVVGVNTTNVPAGSKFLITRYKIGETTATQTEITNAHTSSLNIASACVYRGRVYAAGASSSVTVENFTLNSYPIISHALADGSYTTHGTITGSSVSSSFVEPMVAFDGRIYWQTVQNNAPAHTGLHVTDCTAPLGEASTTVCGVDTLEYNTYAGSPYPVGCTPVIGHPMIVYTSNQANNTTYTEGFRFFTHYLGTINNLPNAIVKAPSQTMKITYTIQEV